MVNQPRSFFIILSIFCFYLQFAEASETKPPTFTVVKSFCDHLLRHHPELTENPLKVVIGIGNMNSLGEVISDRQSIGLLIIESFRDYLSSEDEEDIERKLPFVGRIEDKVTFSFEENSKGERAQQRTLEQAKKLGVDAIKIGPNQLQLKVGVNAFLNNNTPEQESQLSPFEKFQGGTRVLFVEPGPIGDLTGPMINEILIGLKLDPSDLMIVIADLDLKDDQVKVSYLERPTHPALNSIETNIRDVNNRIKVIKVGIGRPNEGTVNTYLAETYKYPEVYYKQARKVHRAIQFVARGQYQALNEINGRMSNPGSMEWPDRLMYSFTNDFLEANRAEISSFLERRGLSILEGENGFAFSIGNLHSNREGFLIVRVKSNEGLSNEGFNDNMWYKVQVSSGKIISIGPYNGF